MKVNLHNDGKEKYQSFEVYIPSVSVKKGFGSNKEEALTEYIKNVEFELNNLQDCLDYLNNDPKMVNVNWCGNPIKQEDQ